MQPKIGITCFIMAGKEPAGFFLWSGYVRGVIDAGGIPVLIPVTELDEETISYYANTIDGLLIPGGEDITPQMFGEDPHPNVNFINRQKDVFEVDLIHRVAAMGKPIFGICRGLQILNVALGGSLIQDIPTQVGSSICHLQSMQIRNEVTHRVSVVPGSLLHQMLGAEEIRVNSYHHQAIKNLAPGLKITAVAPDGIIEGIESENGQIYAVQWHPENLYKRYPVFAGLFTKLIEMSSN